MSQQPTLTLPADLVLTPGAATGLSQQGDIYRYGASAGQAGVVSGTLDTSHYALWDGQGTTLTIIAVLAALLALITHYLMTFVSGALYSTNKALQTVANGDLTFRLNFFPVRDEFSILAGSIDTFTDRQHKIVQLVEESADALTLAADEFREHASDGEQLARAQRQQHGGFAPQEALGAGRDTHLLVFEAVDRVGHAASAHDPHRHRGDCHAAGAPERREQRQLRARHAEEG